MTDKTLAQVHIEEEDGSFFFLLSGAASRAGPFETKEAAIDAATEFLAQTFVSLLSSAITGEPK